MESGALLQTLFKFNLVGSFSIPPPHTRPSLWPYLGFCVHLIRYEYQSCLSVCMCVRVSVCVFLIFDYVSISDCCDDATFLNVYQKVNVSSLYLYISIFVYLKICFSLYLYICISLSVCLFIYLYISVCHHIVSL